MNYEVHKSIDIDFAHHVGGHEGACINIHGHTWKFEICLGAERLDAMGFVVDFKALKQQVLTPVHRLLDHSFAIGKPTFDKPEFQENFRNVGQVLMATRGDNVEKQRGLGYDCMETPIAGAYNHILGGMKVAVMPFNPTSERLAEWLAGVAFQFTRKLADVDRAKEPPERQRVFVQYARIYETLHPVESVATFNVEH